MKNQPTSHPNSPPEALIQKAMELWGREARDLPWEKVDLGPEYLKRHGERAFICTSGQSCEIVQMTLCRIQEQVWPVTYGIGKCLTCEKVYWGLIQE
jgi:hypothetical protein